MDFFAQQDQARTRTGRLVALFILAVVSVILSVYAAVMTGIAIGSTAPAAGLFNPRLFLVIAGITCAVIGLGTLMKMAAISKGGGYVAESLGGQPLNPATQDPDRRRLLNVVEEMALAAGAPVPPVYVLENEEGINAFAAGLSPSDAVIGVTKGCLRQLNREELQGVIAHEFSHILHGDMRLNLRLMGFLGGIMGIATVGEIILRGGRFRSSDRNGKGGAQIMAVALLLLVIGYVGVLVGRLIQSAVCRQREYLADASAVQFTRSTGIALALKKIGGFASGTRIQAPAAGEACHLFFGQAIRSLFATHPPLIDRIRRIEPGFSGDFQAAAAIAPAHPGADVAGRLGLAPQGGAGPVAIEAHTVMNQVGGISSQSVAYGAALLAAIPAPVKKETEDLFGAWAVVCALLLDSDPEARKGQLEAFRGAAAPELLHHLETVAPEVLSLAPELRLPVLDLCLAALRQMSPEQFVLFKKQLRHLVASDNKLTFFEFILQEVVDHRLRGAFAGGVPKILYKNLAPLAGPAALLLTALARAGHRERQAAETAFRAAVAALPLAGDRLVMAEKVSFSGLHEALEGFSRTSFGVKRTLFEACCQCVFYDGRVSVSEAELLRAVAYAVDIPVPPLLASATIR
ncbi:MAG: M48 family metallopeptidase [Deltaproteobacteria bacterium]|nr:M48 family metallopeptidase [Deltaproteobacteria bacterium]